jgi:hypothetical protein
MQNKTFWSRMGMVMMLVLFLSGCTTTSTAPFFYSNNSNYGFVILGEVTYEHPTEIGFQELLKAARSKYPKCDYVIDVMIDSKTTTTTFLFMSGTETTYTMRGTAIHYIRDITEVAENYTVKSVTGRVIRRESQGVNVEVKEGDVLAKDTIVNVGSDSSLVLVNGSTSITIPAGRVGRISDLVQRL